MVSEINKAKQLIKENNYKAALEILSSKIVTGSDNIEEVLQLINTIEKKKLNLIDTSNKVMNLFSKNEFEEANKLSKTLDLSGIYDEETNFIIERSKTLQNTISKRVGFINFVLLIENAIIQYRFKDGLNSIMEAVTIYDTVVDSTLKSDFNALYKEIYTSTIFDYPESTIKNIENFEIKLKSLNEIYTKLIIIEDKVRSLSLQFNSAIEKESNPSVRLGLSAYKAGADRTIDIIIRTVQRNYRNFLNEIFSYSENIVNANDPDIISKLLYLNNFLKNNSFDQLAFYKNRIDFNDSRYFERSKLNIYDYLTYISKKDRLYYKYNEQILISKAQTLENVLIDHKKNINDGELILAGETLRKLITNNTEIRNMKTAFESSISGAFFETPLNKIDKPAANVEKVKQTLAELNLLPEDWGGQTMFVPVSAIKKTNIEKLIESILLQAEVLDLKANAKASASGTVLEARLEKGRGPVVSVLVKRGTLRVGEDIVSGINVGRVKAMVDDRGKPVKETAPGYAVEVLGFEGIPNAGDRFDITATENDARKIAETRLHKVKAASMVNHGKMSLDALFAKIQTGNIKDLGVILKADVFGSVEAIKDSLEKAATEQVKVSVIHAGTGGITESDVMLASASNAIIIGFNVRPETKARQLAEAEKVEIKSYSIIYELLDDIKKAMAGLLDKKKVEKFLGRAEVRQTFSVPKIGVIAGSSVIDGKIIRGANIRLLRDSRVIFDGKMSSLKRFKDDAKEVATGFECGIGIENYNDLKPGDVIEAYQIELVTPELT